jgi:phosphatidate phosphatase PAH1
MNRACDVRVDLYVMQMRKAVVLGVIACCASSAATFAANLPEVRCAGEPRPKPVEFRHIKNRIEAMLGESRHRGIDLIAAADETKQTLTGAITYTAADKALEDEDVDLFACRDGGWTWLGTSRTDEEGRFELTLEGRDRLDAGLRDLYASVAGDRSGSRFLAYVAPAGAKVVVADVDGTLTASENAFPIALFFGGKVGANAGASVTLRSLATAGYQIIYVTARGDRFSAATRAWLDLQGFPRGPMRLARSLVTMPGAATVAYKTGALLPIARRFDIIAAIGNRNSDVLAYTNIGVAPSHIFIKASEFASELVASLRSRAAVGFASYDRLRLN